MSILPASALDWAPWNGSGMMQIKFQNFTTPETGRVVGISAKFTGTRWTFPGSIAINSKGAHVVAHDDLKGARPWWHAASVTWRGHRLSMRLENGTVYDDIAGRAF